MARQRKKVFQVGDRFQTYISSAASEDLINFINKQSDLSSAVLYGFLVLHARYGDRDIKEFIPRTFNPESFEEDFIAKFLGGNIPLYKKSNTNIPTAAPLQSTIPKDDLAIEETTLPLVTVEHIGHINIPVTAEEKSSDTINSSGEVTESKVQTNVVETKVPPTSSTENPMGKGNLFQMSKALTHGKD